MDHCKILESESESKIIQTHVEKIVIQSHDKDALVNVTFDGESYLSSIDLYESFPHVIKSLHPMNSTSTTQLNCEFHIFFCAENILVLLYRSEIFRSFIFYLIYDSTFVNCFLS